MSLERTSCEVTQLCEGLNNVELSKRQKIDTDEIANSESESNPLVASTNPNGDAANSEAIMRQIILDMNSNDHQEQLAATRQARKILSRERHPPIDVIVQLTPRCIEFLSEDGHPELVFEAAWVLTNIASGTPAQTAAVVKAGGVEAFVNLLRSSYPLIVEQSVWALGNIAGDGPGFRDLVISKGIVPPLIALATAITLLRNVAWTLSNLCRTKNPPPPSEATRQILPTLARLINNADVEILSDVCWALSYLRDDKIEDVVKSGVVPRLVGLLDSGTVTVLEPCLRAVGNIATGSHAQTDAVVKAGVLAPLNKLLQSSSKTNIMKDAALIVANICAGTLEQMNAVINSGIVPVLIGGLRTGDFRQETVWAITNITTGGTVEHIVYLYQQGVIPAMCELLTSSDWKMIILILKGLENILSSAQEVGQVENVCWAIEESGGLDKIEQLQSHENSTVYNKASEIIEKFFSKANNYEMEIDEMQK